MLAFRRGKLRVAIELYSQAVTRNPDNWLAWYYMGLSYSKLDNRDEAQRCWQKVLAGCPEQALKGMTEAKVAELSGELYWEKGGPIEPDRRAV